MAISFYTRASGETKVEAYTGTVHPVDIDLGGIGDGRDFGVVLIEQHGFGCTEKTDIAVQGEVKAGTSEGEPTIFGRSGVAVAINVGLAGVNVAGTE